LGALGAVLQFELIGDQFGPIIIYHRFSASAELRKRISPTHVGADAGGAPIRFAQ